MSIDNILHVFIYYYISFKNYYFALICYLALSGTDIKTRIWIYFPKSSSLLEENIKIVKIAVYIQISARLF